jgi:hypothetical protein
MDRAWPVISWFFAFGMGYVLIGSVIILFVWMVAKRPECHKATPPPSELSPLMIVKARKGATGSCSVCRHVVRASGLFDRFQCALSGKTLQDTENSVCHSFVSHGE